MNGKGRGPEKGYNRQAYADNYDRIFRKTPNPAQRKEPMNTQEQPNPHPILPWHRETAQNILCLPYSCRTVGHISAIIAAHDPHAETLRLLEAICGTIEAHEIESLDCDRSGNDYCDCLRKIIAKARAHLAAMKGNQ